MIQPQPLPLLTQTAVTPAPVETPPKQAQPPAEPKAPTPAKTPSPPSYPPPTQPAAQEAPWRATGTAQIAQMRGLNQSMQEFAELRTQHEEAEANYATEKLAFQQESDAFTQELQDCHNAKSEYSTVLQELRNFQKAFRCDQIDSQQWEKIKSWNSWVAHYESDFSKELKAKYGKVDTCESTGTARQEPLRMLALRDEDILGEHMYGFQMC